jgi:hypothetical protein
LFGHRVKPVDPARPAPNALDFLNMPAKNFPEKQRVMKANRSQTAQFVWPPNKKSKSRGRKRKSRSEG